jgi:Mn2+/Fe2+ NRAMP family transporter
MTARRGPSPVRPPEQAAPPASRRRGPTIGDQTATDQTHPDQTHPDQTHPDQTHPDQTHGAQLRSVAPELISGAADNDPTNVGTAAVVGSQTGYALSWVALLVAPLLGVVLAIAAQVGITARADLQTLTKRRYGRRVAALLLVSIVVVNLLTMAADLQAGAAGVGLLAGLDPRWIVLPLGLLLAALLLIGGYGHVVAVLRWLLPGFLAFVAAAILAQPDWPRLLAASFVPTLSFRPAELGGALALLGTTLTSYVYIWETIQRSAESPAPAVAASRLGRARIGAVSSAVFTALILWSMLVASAATLGRLHLPVSSAQDAAFALRPLAGPLAGDVFAAGLIVSALVALPVLVAGTAYIVGAQFDWRRGLSRPVGEARRFYAVIAASIGLAVAATLARVPVFEMLVAASLIGGLATPAGLAVLVRLARDPQVMRGRPISMRLAVSGWMVTAFIGILGAAFIAGSAFRQFLSERGRPPAQCSSTARWLPRTRPGNTLAKVDSWPEPGHRGWAEPLYTRLDTISVSPQLLDGVLGHIERQVWPVLQSENDSRGVALHANAASGAAMLESFWESGKAMQSAKVIDELNRYDAIRQAGDAIRTEDYELATFEQQDVLRAGAAVQLTRLDMQPSAIADAVEVFGDTVVPWLAETDGFSRATLLVNWASGRAVAETCWRDALALEVGQGAADAMRAEVVAAARCEIRGVEQYSLVFASTPGG